VKVAYSINAYTRSNLYAALEKIKVLRFDGVEIVPDTPFVSPEDIDKFDTLGLKNRLSLLTLAIPNVNVNSVEGLGSLIEEDYTIRKTRIEYTKNTLDCKATRCREYIYHK
jgi:sugar phosphate isomerase/epimerase